MPFALKRYCGRSNLVASAIIHAKSETIAMLPGDWDLAHAIRLGIKPFAELGANSEALSGSQVDSPCSCRAIFESAPVAMLQSPVLVESRSVGVPGRRLSNNNV